MARFIAKSQLDTDVPKEQGVLLEPELSKKKLKQCLLVAMTLLTGAGNSGRPDECL